MDIFIVEKVFAGLKLSTKFLTQQKKSMEKFSPRKVNDENLSPCNTIRINILASFYNSSAVASLPVKIYIFR